MLELVLRSHTLSLQYSCVTKAHTAGGVMLLFRSRCQDQTSIAISDQFIKADLQVDNITADSWASPHGVSDANVQWVVPSKIATYTISGTTADLQCNLTGQFLCAESFSIYVKKASTLYEKICNETSE